MGLLPEGASFAERVAECFLAHRGQGLMLSPLDLALVGEWAQREVPLEVVARGIRLAAEQSGWDARPGQPALRSLRACRRQVEAEIRKHDRAGAGRGGGPARATRRMELERHHRLMASLRGLLGEGEVQPEALGRLICRLEAAPPADPLQGGHQEEWALASLVRTLPYPARRLLLRQARARVSEGPASSRWARRQALRFERGLLCRQVLRLPPFW